MRGRVHRSDIRVEREEEYQIDYISGNTAEVIWTASFGAPLWTEEDVAVENLSLSFTGPTYDEALDKLMAEFKALDIEVML